MSHYHHLTITEREKILVLHEQKKSLHVIAREMGRSVSTISREIKRNVVKDEVYSAAAAQKRYQKRRKRSRRRKLLENTVLMSKVTKLFLEQQWSPEQISNRLIYENDDFKISYNTIYRAIYAGMLDVSNLSRGNRGVIRKLRHRGKTRRKKGTVETRGKIVISNRIQERPKEAEERKVIGHWEADTMAGKQGSACLITLTDRCSRYLLASKVAKRYSELVAEKMIETFSNLPDEKLRSVTPDRGKEFAKHSKVTEALSGVQFYFPDPHAPWQRGTNENTNGLIREYLPKSYDIAATSESDIIGFVNKINMRPRKCLGWKSPHEVFFNVSLHLT